MDSFVCNLCPRNCSAIRTETENIGGFCGLPDKMHIALAAPHFWEEPPISGKNGSGAIFFSGCQLRCGYCQNYALSHENFGKAVTPQRLSEIFRELESRGVHNINLVSPTPWVLHIKRALDIYRPKIPVVYNSGGYETAETLRSLEGYIDIFLLDFKYADPTRSAKYSAARDYPTVAEKALDAAYSSVGAKVIDAQGIMQKGVVLRHLLLPSGTRDAMAVIDIVKSKNYDLFFSLMAQYTPTDKVKHCELGRKVTDREYQKVLEYLYASGIDGFAQEKDSSDPKFTPTFDLSGV